MSLKCNINFQSRFAKIGSTQITIDDVISDKFSKESSFKCVPGDHELIPVLNCTKKRPHFRHKYKHDVDGSHMTEWHNEWQSNFAIVEQPFRYKAGQLRDRRADVVIPEYKRIIEIQHSPIASGEVIDRMKDYELHGHAVTWVVHGQDIDVERLGERLILKFNLKNSWKFESFLTCTTLYYDIDGLIYKVNPTLIRSLQIDVTTPHTKTEFVDSLNTNKDLWEVEEPPQCYLYVKQQGAGSGKTYGLMQALNNDPEIYNFRYYIFITKQHSAVNVMYNEFENQYNNGKLTNIEMYDDPIKGNKKYIVNYYHKLSGKECIAVFATVDSFTYAIGDKNASAYDKFVAIVESIKQGTIRTDREGKLTYANVNTIMNKEMLIVIDETQDLTELYGEAFLKVVQSKHTNLCIVGDRLQSLAYQTNALTFLHKVEKPLMKVVKANSTNNVIRYKNKELIDFVNSMIPFESYGLPNVSLYPGLEYDTCSNPLTIIKSKYKVYANDSMGSDNIISAIEEIMMYFDREVKENNRVPEDFMIITPFTKRNPIMEALQISLNVYWRDLMQSNEAYIENVKNKHEYWKAVNVDEYKRYAIFHKSEEGNSIDLKESEYATRMVSIHSSKGDGRPVVFVIGLSEAALQMFSQVSNNLIYDSLLHVAITRQKERLYFRLENDKDDIGARIHKSVSSVEFCSQGEFNIVKNNSKLSDIMRDVVKNQFDEINEKIISVNSPPPLPKNEDNKQIVDMCDHHIRYASMFMNTIIHCCNYQLTHTDIKKQYVAILSRIRSDILKPVIKWNDYITCLIDNKDKNSENPLIPVLKLQQRADGLDYDRYYGIIYNTMLRVIVELQSIGKKTINYLCPLESVILYYMIECIENGRFQSITINDVYNIIHTYSCVFSDTLPGHDNCNCKSNFKTIKSVDESQTQYYEYLCNHYERLYKTNKMIDEIDQMHKSINWLYMYPVAMNGGNDEFSIRNNCHMIGDNNDSVIHIYLKPQFTALNYNEFLLNSLYDTYLLSNSNKERFGNKKIISYVISLNNESIYTVDWTDAVKETTNNILIKNSLYDALFKKYSIRHKQYYDVFCHLVRTSSDKSPRVLFSDIKSKLNDEKIPEYMLDAFKSIEFEIDNCNKQKDKLVILNKYLNFEDFNHRFNQRLERSLEEFLNIEEESEENEIVYDK